MCVCDTAAMIGLSLVAKCFALPNPFGIVPLAGCGAGTMPWGSPAVCKLYKHRPNDGRTQVVYSTFVPIIPIS